jgi:hypothetical protein
MAQTAARHFSYENRIRELIQVLFREHDPDQLKVLAAELQHWFLYCCFGPIAHIFRFEAGRSWKFRLKSEWEISLRRESRISSKAELGISARKQLQRRAQNCSPCFRTDVPLCMSMPNSSNTWLYEQRQTLLKGHHPQTLLTERLPRTGVPSRFSFLNPDRDRCGVFFMSCVTLTLYPQQQPKIGFDLWKP